MKPTTETLKPHHQIIAALLWYGTWLASAPITAGALLTAIDPLPASLTLPLNGYDTVKPALLYSLSCRLPG